MPTIDDSELEILQAFEQGQLKSVATKTEGSYWIPGWSRIPLRYKILITVFTPHTRSILGQGRLDV